MNLHYIVYSAFPFSYIRLLSNNLAASRVNSYTPVSPGLINAPNTVRKGPLVFPPTISLFKVLQVGCVASCSYNAERLHITNIGATRLARESPSFTLVCTRTPFLSER